MRYTGIHVPDCYAVAAVAKGDWSTPWYFVGVERRRKNGYRSGPREMGWRGFLFSCNCTRCAAAFWILEEDALDRIEEAR